jgi:ABC-type Zn2+ transport system substrate-binding protein/surface adhesin
MMLFENFLLTASSVQGTSSVESITALIVAISTAVGTIGALVVAIASRIKISLHDRDIQKAADTAISVGKMATAFGQKTAEQQDEIKTVAKIIADTSPDAKKMLDDNQKGVEYWTERSRVAEAQLNKLLSLITPEAQANNMNENELVREELRKIKR